MKSILSKIMEVIESLGKARAAAELARAGYHKEAQAIMLEK